VINKYVVINNENNYIENKCISIIEEHLDLFFSSCLKSTYGYSIMISNNLNIFNLQSFESMVISNKEIEEVISTILGKINAEIEKNLGFYVEVDNVNSFNSSSLQLHKNLVDTVEIFKASQKITKFCEKTIKTFFQKAFKNLCPFRPAQHVVKQFRISSKILGNKSHATQVEIHQDKIYRQIQGMLLNLKIDIRNHLMEKTLENISYIRENVIKSNNYSIA